MNKVATVIESSIQKSVFRHVESEIYAYSYRKKEINRLRDEILNPTKTDENIGGGKGNIPGDPTGKAAISLATHAKLVHMERTQDAIDEVFNKLPDVKKELIRLKYWTTPQRLTTVGICEKLGISESTFRRWRLHFVQDVALILGW